MIQVFFIKGKKENYSTLSPEEKAGGIYFATDTREIIVEGVSYGSGETLEKTVKLVSQGPAPGSLSVTYTDGSLSEINIVTELEGKINSLEELIKGDKEGSVSSKISQALAWEEHIH